MFVFSVVAQISDGIKGIVVNESGEPLAGVIVTQIVLPDSSVIANCITNEDGKFAFSANHGDMSRTLLEASLMGCAKSYAAATADVRIVLNESIMLDMVVVKASNSSVKRKNGKFIYTPGGSDLSAIDSYELLRYAPLLTVENNSVAILGKGISTIYINGCKPVMDNVSLMEMLRSLPASKIENIEIITTPGSSYKASTTGGIVNITIKQTDQGLTGSASVTGSYLGERFSPSTSLYLGYSKGKFNSSANLGFSHHRMLNETDADYNYITTDTKIQNSMNDTGYNTSLAGSLNATYDFSKRSVLGASFFIGGSSGNRSSTTISQYITGGVAGERLRSSDITKTPYKRPKIGAVVYYNLKTDDRGSNLDLSGNFSTYYNLSMGNMEYAQAEADGSFIPDVLFTQNRVVDGSGYEFTAKYRHVFADDSHLESGYEYNGSRLSNDFLHQNFNGTQYVDDPLQSNHFIYNEQCNALYMNYERAWNDVVSTTIGLRAEYTHIDGDQRTSGETFKSDYIDFFPQLSLNFEFADGDHSLAFDMSRSIVRPFNNDLNPFKIWTSENTYTMGNPTLEPMIYTDVELNYTLFGNYIFGAAYSYGSNAFGEYTYAGENNTTVSSKANFGHEQGISIYFNLNKVFFKGIWRLAGSVSADYDMTYGMIGDEDISYRDWRTEVSIRNTFRLSATRGFVARLNYSYSTPSRGITRIGKHKHLLGVALSKQFKFGGALSLDVYNLFNYRPAYNYSTADYAYKFNPRTNNVIVQVKYSQSFGHKQVRGARDRSSTKYIDRYKQ